MRSIRSKLLDEWNEFLRERELNLKTRRELDEYGFVRSFSARYQHWLVLFGIPLISLSITSILIRDAGMPILGPILGVTAAVLGVQQWRAARNEISLDKFYERLGVTNKHLDDCEVTREFAGPWRDDTGEISVYSKKIYQRSMYVYRELDNLEYAIVKYKIGFMSSPIAYRALNTFRARCQVSPIFCEIVKKCVDPSTGYDRGTKDVVAKCVEDAKRQREGK